MEDETYHRFRSARQEPVRLQAALDGFFAFDGEDERQKEYGIYLKKRIRPAMEALIRSQQIEQMEILAEQGWYGKKELETFIRTAREEGSLQALVWLMKEKNDRYGYEDREYDL